MIIQETFEVAAAKLEVAALLTDVERISRCVPGVHGVEARGDGSYAATLRLQMGPITASFRGDLQLDDSQKPNRLVARGRGTDRHSGSQADVHFTADLEQSGADRTIVRASADVAIRGRLGQFGTGVIRSTAHELVASFAGCVNTSLQEGLGGAAVPRAVPPSVWRIAMRGAIAWIAGWLRGLRDRDRPRPSAQQPRRDAEEQVEDAGGPQPSLLPAAPMPRRTMYLEPQTLEDACAALRAHAGRAKAISGGTAVVLMMQQGLMDPEVLVSLAGIEQLTGIGRHGGFVRIGAGTTLTEVARSSLVRDRLPSLATACAGVGNARIRNVATLGGNLAEADYASDPPSVLTSLAASCTVRGAEGVRTVPVADLITGFYTTVLDPDEVITEILVPTPDIDRRATYQKYVSRSSEDRPCVGVAARVDLNDHGIRALDVVVGAVAPTPQRIPDVTTEVVGNRLDDAVIDHVSASYAQRIDPMDDARGSSWYRRRMIEVFVRRALQDLRRFS